MSLHPDNPGYRLSDLPAGTEPSSHNFVEGSFVNIEQYPNSYNQTFASEEQPIPLHGSHSHPDHEYDSRLHYTSKTPELEVIETYDENYMSNDARTRFTIGRSQQSDHSYNNCPDPYVLSEAPDICLPDATPSSDYDRTAPHVPMEERQYHANSTIMRYVKTKAKLVQAGISTLEYPVPSAVKQAIQSKYRTDDGQNSTEFTHMRYTPCTCDPDDFTLKNGYNLRPSLYNRHTEMLIAITYYNEDRFLTARTLHSVMQNVRDIVNVKQSEFWNKHGPAWQKIVVCLIFDGVNACDKEVLDILATMGLYQDGVMKKDVSGREVVTHIFEYTTQISVTPDQQLCRPNPMENDATTLPPVQMIFCLKQKNCKKVNSHRWVFNAFARILNPEVCVLLDAGVKLDRMSLFSVWKAFYNDRYLGGACGETSVMLRSWKSLLNPLVAFQNFEYKMHNILDKPLENLFGIVNTSPGSFSAYRYRAILGRPLEQYFRGDHTLMFRLGRNGIDGMSLFKKNMFLVEERVICFELASKAGTKWHLSYVKSAKGEVDVPEHTFELIGQRRRWLNGIFTNAIHKLLHFPHVYRSGHSVGQLLLFNVQILYEITWLVLYWFSLAAFFLVIRIIFATVGQSADGAKGQHAWPFGNNATSIINTVLLYLYLGFLVLQFFLAYGSRPKGFQTAYKVSFAGFALIQLYLTVLFFYSIHLVSTSTNSDGIIMNEGIKVFLKTSFGGDINNTIVTAFIMVCGIFVFASLIYRNARILFTSSIQYLFLMTAFTNILFIYAISNFHDVSWGTRGSDRADILPSVRVLPGGGLQGVVFEELEDRQTVLDTEFAEAVKRALAPYNPPPKEENDYSHIEDHYKNFRTCLVIAWILSNALLSIIITDNTTTSFKYAAIANDRSEHFVQVLLIIITMLTLIRFLGCCWYLVWTSFWNLFAQK